MSVCQFPLQARVAFKNDTKMRGLVYDWFDGDRDIPASKSLYAIQWTGISGFYWYYADDLVLEKDLPAFEKKMPETTVVKKFNTSNTTNGDVAGTINYADPYEGLY